MKEATDWCIILRFHGVCIRGMSCRHLGTLTARWEYLTHDGTCGTGWVACVECDSRLERLSVAGGRIRPQGRFVAAFQEQIAANGAFSDLRELEVD